MTVLKLLKKKSYSKNARPNNIVTFLNPYSYLFFRKNLDLFKRFDHIYIDGILLVYLLRLIGHKVERRSFDMTSMAPMVFDECIKRERKIFFIGAKEIEIKLFVDKVLTKYPKLNVCGFKSGHFDKNTAEIEVIQEINYLDPDIVIVGMGTPLQEKFLLRLNESGWKGSGYTCGGFFHQTAKKINYYPYLIDKFNLRWLYRIVDEPKLFKRYCFYYPLSILFFTFDMIQYKVKHED